MLMTTNQKIFISYQNLIWTPDIKDKKVFVFTDLTTSGHLIMSVYVSFWKCLP